MRSLRSIPSLWLGLALVLAACDQPTRSDDDGDGEAGIGWLQDAAVPFATVDAGAGFGDLAPLGKMIGDARIVGLGEATHGTSEFFRMKHRVLEYLVRERGFRNFGIEATWAEATRINRYLHTGEGDPAVLLSNLYFWTWNTREVLDMIQWMRAYNHGVPEAQRLSFYGFDVQFSRVAMNDVAAYLRRVNAAAADSAEAYFACYRGYQDRIGQATPNYATALPEVKQACRAGVRAVHALMERRAGELVGATGRAAYETALRTARVVVQNEDMRGHPDGTNKRDTYMAENVAWIADVAEPGERVVLWAHNAHMSRWLQFMGVPLTSRFGAGYVVVGFSFYRGGLNAVEATTGLRAVTAEDARPGSYEHEFNRLGHARFYVDLRPVRAGSVPRDARWLLGPRLFRMVGATYRLSSPNDVYATHELAREYDIMIHLTDVTATQLLSFRYD